MIAKLHMSLTERAGRDCRQVYLLGDGEFVKIGISKSLNKRVTQIQSGNPKPVKLLGVWSVGDAARCERNLLGILHRHRACGEWLSILQEEAFNVVDVLIATLHLAYIRWFWREKEGRVVRGRDGSLFKATPVPGMRDLTVVAYPIFGHPLVGEFVSFIHPISVDWAIRSMRNRPLAWKRVPTDLEAGL